MDVALNEQCAEDFLKRRQSQKSILRVLDGQDRALTAGGYSLHQYEPGKYWLENPIGEGMETSEARLAALLAKFFQQEF